MERLTKKINKTVQDKYSLGSYLYYDFNGLNDTNNLLNKLGKIEDIMEKYGIESVEELEQCFKIVNEKDSKMFLDADDDLKHMSYNFVKNLWCVAEQQRDAWKKACELACESLISNDGKETLVFLKTGIQIKNSKQAIDYFYQQAQKES